MDLRELLTYVRHEGTAGPLDVRIAIVLPLSPANERLDALSWCNEKNIGMLPQLKAGVVLCPVSAKQAERPAACTFIFCGDPRAAYRDAFNALYPPVPVRAFRAPSAVVSPDARIGVDVHIGHHVVIEEGCAIGDNSHIGNGTVLLANTVLGARVRIGCNCTIGGVGFGYQPDANGDYERMPHVGNVRIDDDVEIGSNTCIDKGSMGSTWLQRNVKVDNLVHIAHNVVVGENSLVIAHAMIGGSSVLGRNTWIAPSAAIRNKCDVGDGAVVGLGAVVVKSVDPGTTVAGNPAKLFVPKA